MAGGRHLICHLPADRPHCKGIACADELKPKRRFGYYFGTRGLNAGRSDTSGGLARINCWRSAVIRKGHGGLVAACCSNRSDKEGNGSSGTMGSGLASFARLVDDRSGSRIELQTSVVSYWKAAPWWDILHPEVQVDLVSVVHIGDREYYEALQEELLSYDLVLYEMVREKGPGAGEQPPGSREDGARPSSDRQLQRGVLRPGAHARAAKEGSGRPEQRASKAVRGKRRERVFESRRKGTSLVSHVQGLLSRLLSLRFQLDCLDYRAPHFRNADLDLATFRQLQAERGEDFFSFARQVAVLSSQAVFGNPPSNSPESSAAGSSASHPVKQGLLWAARCVPMPLLGLLLIEGTCAPPESALLRRPEVQLLLQLDVARALKLLLARQLTADFLSPASDFLKSSVMIGARNEAAMQELQAALREGHRRVAILYGSAHLPDFDQRLQEDLHFRPVKLQWRTAWRIREPARQARPQAKQPVGLRGSQSLSYKIVALGVLSVVLAADLCMWEAALQAMQGAGMQVVFLVAQVLDLGWAL